MADSKMRGPKGETWADMVCMGPPTRLLYNAMSSKNLVGMTSVGFDDFATASVCFSEPHERHSKDYERHKNTHYKECLTGEDKNFPQGNNIPGLICYEGWSNSQR